MRLARAFLIPEKPHDQAACQHLPRHGDVLPRSHCRSWPFGALIGSGVRIDGGLRQVLSRKMKTPSCAFGRSIDHSGNSADRSRAARSGRCRKCTFRALTWPPLISTATRWPSSTKMFHRLASSSASGPPEYRGPRKYVVSRPGIALHPKPGSEIMCESVLDGMFQAVSDRRGVFHDQPQRAVDIAHERCRPATPPGACRNPRNPAPPPRVRSPRRSAGR